MLEDAKPVNLAQSIQQLPVFAMPRLAVGCIGSGAAWLHTHGAAFAIAAPVTACHELSSCLRLPC